MASTPKPARVGNARTITVWTLALLLAAMFAFSALGKFSNENAPNGGSWESQVQDWGFPGWFYLVIAVTELVGALALIAPQGRFYGATLLVGVMAGASLTHLANAEYIGIAIPLVLAAPLGIVAWLTRPAWLPGRLAPAPKAAA